MHDKSNSPTVDDRYTVPALQRGLQLLMQFNRNERELSGAELSRRLSLPRASVFRMLCTLEQGGFVERVGDSGFYKLGLSVLRLGFELLASMELTEHGRSILEELRNRCGYSAHLLVRDGSEAVFVEKAAGTQSRFHSIQVGARLPAHATVVGRLLLQGLPRGALRVLYPEDPLPTYTPRTPTTLDKLIELIEQHKRDGYAVSQSGFETGISTIAAPVFNDHSNVAAVLSITVPSPAVQPQELDGLIQQVREAAIQLTQRISHLPSQGKP